MRDSGYSKDTLQRTFYNFLESSPSIKVIKRSDINLRIDATYFKKICLIVYQDNYDGYIQLIRFSDGENFEEIKEDLDNLIKLGIKIESITSDGHKSILKAVKKSLPDVTVQRCLVHIQRMCLIWLTKYPKHEAGQELRIIVLMLLKIQTKNDQRAWIIELKAWYNKYKYYINEKTYQIDSKRYWYTHKLLRRSYQTIIRALGVIVKIVGLICCNPY
jgi:hypothetical protein